MYTEPDSENIVFLFILLLCWMYKYTINHWGAKKKFTDFKWKHVVSEMQNFDRGLEFFRYMNSNNVDNHSIITQCILRYYKITKDFHGDTEG